MSVVTTGARSISSLVWVAVTAGRRVHGWIRRLGIRRHWAVQGACVGALLVVACGSVGGGVAPTPPPPAPAAPSPSPAEGAGLAPSALAPSPSPSPSPSPAAGGESYTIAQGDTLGTIAQRFYGDENEWRRIYDANREAIGGNPDSVRVGTTLRIPPKP